MILVSTFNQIKFRTRQLFALGHTDVLNSEFQIFRKDMRYCSTELVEALRYKPEGRGFDSRWCNPSGRTLALRLTQTIKKMSSRNTF
jgi:hypothetical protein